MNLNTCLAWHKKCNAECCKSLSFKVNIPKHKLKKGKLLRLKVNEKFTFIELGDHVNYWALHGIHFHDIIFGGIYLYVRLVNFQYKDGILRIFRTCDWLNDDLTCKGHPDKKPNVCKELNKDTILSGKYTATPNCRFLYEIAEEQNGNYMGN